jgi:hypothetical protein
LGHELVYDPLGAREVRLAVMGEVAQFVADVVRARGDDESPVVEVERELVT